MFSYTIPTKAALPLRWMTQFLSGSKHDFFGQFSNPVPRSRNADYSQQSFPIIIALRTSLFHAFSLPNPLRLENDWNIFPNSIIMPRLLIIVILKNHSSQQQSPTVFQGQELRRESQRFERHRNLAVPPELRGGQGIDLVATPGISIWKLRFFFPLWFLHFSMIFY